MNLLGWRALLGDSAGQVGLAIYAAPARAEDLTGLPPAYIDCGTLEVFRVEGIEHATRLMQAGVAMELHCWHGVFHGWELGAPSGAVTQRAMAARSGAEARAAPDPARRSVPDQAAAGS